MIAADELKGSDGFRYDLVDVTRQVLANYADTLQRNFSKDYAELNYKGLKERPTVFLRSFQIWMICRVPVKNGC